MIRITENYNKNYKKKYNEHKIFQMLKQIDKTKEWVKCIDNVYTLLKEYKEYDGIKFIECVNEYFNDLDYFQDPSDTELLRDMLIYYMNINSYEWVELFNKHTDYTSSEIREFIIRHCEQFGLDEKEFQQFL